MRNDNAQINILLQKLEALLIKQNSFAKEINELKQDIYDLINSRQKVEIKPDPINSQHLAEPIAIPKPEFVIPAVVIQTIPTPTQKPVTSRSKTSTEKFIGENLISKIGIIITIIGVAIGAKYSIDHELISPIARIIIGYLVGLGLLATGYSLKKKYENYSAVLVSGAMTILYFITFSAYNFYHLIPLQMTFVLMVLFTIFTVYAALNFNNKVIALFGLVGAYAVPFLLSDGSGKVIVLFSYMAIINVGILFIAVKKYWKLLYYVSFGLTWLIFSSWYFFSYSNETHFKIALLFSILFFLIFYAIFLSYKLIKKEKYGGSDIVMLLLNSFIFYGLGYLILDQNYSKTLTLGFFTFCNAILHYIISSIIHKQKLSDSNLFYLISGLVLVFITITFPVLLNGNWVTLFWAGEAALLYWIGNTKKVAVYEKLSYPLMLLSFFSLLEDFFTRYNNYSPELPTTKLTPILNVNFLTSILFIAAFGFITYLKNKRGTHSIFNSEKLLNTVINFAIPAILIISCYYTFQLEIDTYFNQRYKDAILLSGRKYEETVLTKNILQFNSIWTINYSLLFLTVLSYVNTLKVKNRTLAVITIGLNTLFLLIFLSNGLLALNILKQSYLNTASVNSFSIYIRYISYTFVALLFFTTYKCIKQYFMQPLSAIIKIVLDCLLYITILWVATVELIMYLQLTKHANANQLGVSIFWGVYAMLLIFLGIGKAKKYLRIMGFVIFAITLLKLFLYDIADLDTISKTIVFVSLGMLLLIISFIYNKYKHLIIEEKDKK
jgi:uncharacterized membrane protein